MIEKVTKNSELNIDSLFESLGNTESPYKKELNFNYALSDLGEKYPDKEKEFISKLNSFFKVEAEKKGIDFISTLSKNVPNLDKNS